MLNLVELVENYAKLEAITMRLYFLNSWMINSKADTKFIVM